MLHRFTAFAVLTFVFLAAPGCDEVLEPKKEAKSPEAKKVEKKQETPMVSVRVYNREGQLVGPIKMPAVRLTPEEWQKRLEPEAYRILRKAGTEAPGCGTLLDNKRDGVYTCAGCSLPLFSSTAKFDSGTGWPSFFQPVAPENVENRKDVSHGMVRVEIVCARCEGHLGHVFRDGPKPTGLRYCLNSASMAFTDAVAVKTLFDPLLDKPKKETKPKHATVVLAGGCFWCVEAVFEELDGVIDAVSGYAGGSEKNANYPSVASGFTKHAEAVKITYDPAKITYAELLAVHFATHDPTTLNRQGADVGPHYRSAIFYASDKEKKAAADWIAAHQKKLGAENKIVTTLEPLTGFYPAEAKHQDFVCNNPDQSYVRAVAMPKVKKVRSKFKDKIKQK